MNIIISLHANLRDQVHGDRNSRAHDLVCEKEMGEGGFGSEKRSRTRLGGMLRKIKRDSFL